MARHGVSELPVREFKYGMDWDDYAEDLEEGIGLSHNVPAGDVRDGLCMKWIKLKMDDAAKAVLAEAESETWPDLKKELSQLLVDPQEKYDWLANRRQIKWDGKESFHQLAHRIKKAVDKYDPKGAKEQEYFLRFRLALEPEYRKAIDLGCDDFKLEEAKKIASRLRLALGESATTQKEEEPRGFAGAAMAAGGFSPDGRRGGTDCHRDGQSWERHQSHRYRDSNQDNSDSDEDQPKRWDHDRSRNHLARDEDRFSPDRGSLDRDNHGNRGRRYDGRRDNRDRYRDDRDCYRDDRDRYRDDRDHYRDDRDRYPNDRDRHRDNRDRHRDDRDRHRDDWDRYPDDRDRYRDDCDRYQDDRRRYREDRDRYQDYRHRDDRDRQQDDQREVAVRNCDNQGRANAVNFNVAVDRLVDSFAGRLGNGRRN